MSIAASGRTPIQWLRATVSVFLTLGGATCCLTLLYLGMRAIMEIGGACASGGPYVPAVECPEGVPLLMMAGIWGGIIFVGLYLWSTSKHKVPTLAGFAWPALFLSLGWNFFDYGIDPPIGEGLVWGWLVCAILFALMGGLPLLAMAKPIMSQFGRKFPQVPEAKVVVPTKSKVKKLREAQKPKPQSSQRFGFDPKPPGAAGPDPAADDSLVDELERLRALHQSGALSDREFALAKKRLIEGEV